MPTPTIPAGNLFMNATLYTGTGATQAITNGVSGTSFQPDLVWVKSRSAATDHKLTDSVRGTTKGLISDTTGAETTDTNGLTVFGTSGFTVGSDTNYNNSAATYVAWQWKAGGTAVTNTSGSISSQVSANTTSGFSVVTWTGNNTSGATIGHGLGVAPKLLITKSRTNASSWVVGVGNISGFGVNDYLILQTTDAVSSSSTFYQAYGTNTFMVGVSAANEMNKTSNNYVTYCWTPIDGYSAFGSYTGNGSTDGPFIYTGFRPRWVLLKAAIGTTGNWVLLDTSRDTYNMAVNVLEPDVSDAEVVLTPMIDILSNGFKVRRNSAGVNGSGNTYIYMAFAENPFKYANAR